MMSDLILVLERGEWIVMCSGGLFTRHHHHNHVHEGLGVFRVPWSSKWNWSLHLFLGRPMFLRPFGLYCNACFSILFVSILCTCCSHFSWYCFISFTRLDPLLYGVHRRTLASVEIFPLLLLCKISKETFPFDFESVMKMESTVSAETSTTYKITQRRNPDGAGSKRWGQWDLKSRNMIF